MSVFVGFGDASSCGTSCTCGSCLKGRLYMDIFVGFDDASSYKAAKALFKKAGYNIEASGALREINIYDVHTEGEIRNLLKKNSITCSSYYSE